MKKPIRPELDCEILPIWGTDTDGAQIEHNEEKKTHYANKKEAIHKLVFALRNVNFSAIRIPLTLSLTNQIISSGGNFLLSIYLARVLSLADYGIYGIGYGLCMLYVGVGNAVILTQMSVNMSAQETGQRDAYAAKMLNAVLALGACVLTLAAIGFVIAKFAFPDAPIFFGKVSAVAVAAALFLCNEFFISYAYLQRQESLALVVNGLTISLLFICLYIEHALGIGPSVEHTLYFYALGSAVGAATAYKLSSIKVRDGIHEFAPTITDSWRHGRWALGGVIVTWMQSQAYAYIAMFFLGSTGVGLVNAARLFISPFSFLLSAIQKITIPRLADLRQSNPSRVLHVSVLLTAGLTIMTILYSIVLLSNVNLVSEFVLGRRDESIGGLIGIWCLVLIFQMVRAGGGVLLQVQKKFRILTLLNIPSAVIAVGLAFLLTQKIGAIGAIWSVAIGEVALSFLIWREISNDRTHSS
jgi:O-antigen/teichoic acid export membrane protein